MKRKRPCDGPLHCGNLAGDPDPWVAAPWFGLTGASLENKKINRLK